jgi:hypothetical protein
VLEQFGRVKRIEDFTSSSKRIKFIDTVGSVISGLSALVCYTENEYFREPIVENGIIIKDGFLSSDKVTRLRYFNIFLVIILCKYL